MTTYVYHGSNLDLRKLVPTVNEKKEVEPLLAKLDREEAVLQGLIASLNASHKVKAISSDAQSLYIELENTSPILTRAMLEKRVIYLYTSEFSSVTEWVRVNSNGIMTSDATTLKSINPIDKSRIHIHLWLLHKRVTIKHKRF